MKFGVREICDVVFKAKKKMTVGDKIFYENEPVIYFDSLKTSTLEGAATTVYAQGGKGNSRLIAWEGERTVTFTMEDALISPIGFAILSGANVISANGTGDTTTTEIVSATIGTDSQDNTTITLTLTKTPIAEKPARVIFKQGDYGYYTFDNGKITAENRTVVITLDKTNDAAVIGDISTGDNATVTYTTATGTGTTIKQHTTEITDKVTKKADSVEITLEKAPYYQTGKEYIYVMVLNSDQEPITEPYCKDIQAVDKVITIPANSGVNDLSAFSDECTVLVDYYIERPSGAKQIDITPDSFGGNFYVEASTLFRTTKGTDLPAEFIIPNAKVQSNFTFSMASTGDPSTFTFTMDAFPDTTRFDNTKKVLAAIQIIENADSDGDSALNRIKTPADKDQD